MRYRCNHCGSTFSEPEHVPVETGVVDPTGYFRETQDIAICPDCGYDEVEEYVECLICDEPALQQHDYCAGCMTEMKMALDEAFEEFIKNHPDATADDCWDIVYNLYSRYEGR